MWWSLMGNSATHAVLSSRRSFTVLLGGTENDGGKKEPKHGDAAAVFNHSFNEASFDHFWGKSSDLSFKESVSSFDLSVALI